MASRSGPLLTRTLARWPTCLYALRIGTFSRLISASSTMLRSPGATWTSRESQNCGGESPRMHRQALQIGDHIIT